MPNLTLPTVGLEIEIWKGNYQALHGESDPADTFSEPILSAKLEEITERGEEAGALAVIVEDGGVYEILTQPTDDIFDLSAQLQRLIRAGLIPRHSVHASSMHVNLGFEGVIDVESPDKLISDVHYASSRALRVAEALGATRPERLLSTGVKTLFSRDVDIQGMTDVVQTTYGGWNCRGYTGFDIGNTRPDGKTVWIGDSSRVEFRTPCYIDAPTTVSSAAVLQAMFASELLLMSEAGDDELRDELATHAMDVFAASVGNSIRLFPMGDDGVPLSFDDTQALKEILTSNAHFIKNKRSTPEGKILLDSTSTYVNSIRRCAGQSAIRLAFS